MFLPPATENEEHRQAEDTDDYHNHDYSEKGWITVGWEDGVHDGLVVLDTFHVTVVAAADGTLPDYGIGVGGIVCGVVEF